MRVWLLRNLPAFGVSGESVLSSEFPRSKGRKANRNPASDGLGSVQDGFGADKDVLNSSNFPAGDGGSKLVDLAARALSLAVNKINYLHPKTYQKLC